LAGARLLGQFSREENYLVITFNTAVKDEESYSINAIVLDPETTLPGVATDVDRRWLRRVILPTAASFIEGMGAAISQNAGTSVSVQGETVTTDTEDLDTEEEIGKAVEGAAQTVSDIMLEGSNNVETLVKVRAGTPIGILFLAPVLENVEGVSANQGTNVGVPVSGTVGVPNSSPSATLDIQQILTGAIPAQ